MNADKLRDIDSRVSPEVIFDARPGELFVLRNIANLVPPYGPNDDLHGTSAALEFGVMGLGVEHIVLMGHASCGGVRAFAYNEQKPAMKHFHRAISSGNGSVLSVKRRHASDLRAPRSMIISNV